MKKLIPLMAALLLLSACGGSSGGETSVSSSQGGDSSISEQSSGATEEYKLTFLNNAEIYVDFNFAAAPAGLAIKIGDQTLTSSGKVKMSKDFTYEVLGEFTAPLNLYHIVDTGIATACGAGEGIDAEVAKERVGRYLGNFAAKQYEYRVYFCLSDQTRGWSKTLANVNELLSSYVGK